MLCLRCGHCCRTMSPLTEDSPEGLSKEPCPKLSYDGTVAVCSLWGSPERPDECHAHRYPQNVCPIGMDVLSILEEGLDARIKEIAEADDVCRQLTRLCGLNKTRKGSS